MLGIWIALLIALNINIYSEDTFAPKESIYAVTPIEYSKEWQARMDELKRQQELKKIYENIINQKGKI
jgi:hypothetical protein